MIKRISALFIILLVNIILFAHAVIPHYHHKSDVCIVSFHSQTNSEADKHRTTDHKHEHNSESNTEYCASKQVFVIPDNQAKQEYNCLDFPDNWIYDNQFLANPSYQKLIGFFPASLHSSQAPLLLYSYCHYLSNGLGLRAPPIV
jgi:hypothetical protein